MKTFILTAMLALTAGSCIIATAQPAFARGGAATKVCPEGKTANGECVNAGLAARMRQNAGGN